MSGFRSSVVIDRPVGEVWQRLVHWESAPEWMNGVDACRGAHPLVEGAVLTFQARGAERSAVVRKVVAERQLVLESRQGGVVATYTYSCLPEGSGTQLELDAQCQASGAIVLLMPLIRYLMKKSDEGQPKAFKRWVEGTRT